MNFKLASVLSENSKRYEKHLNYNILDNLIPAHKFFIRFQNIQFVLAATAKITEISITENYALRLEFQGGIHLVRKEL